MNVASSSTTFTIESPDQSASVIAYSIPKTTYTPTLGDATTFSAYNAGYQDAPELVAGNSSNGVFTATKISTGNSALVPPFVLTIPEAYTAGDGAGAASGVEAAAYPYGESIITLDNVYFNSSYASLSTTANTGYYINDGLGDGIEMYDYKSDSAVLAAVTAADAANPTGFSSSTAYDITAYADVYYGETEIYPLSITAVSVPEPTTIGLLGLAATGLLGRRRRHA